MSNLAISGRVNPQRFNRGAVWGRTSQCALVLEDLPVSGDSRLEFESFPEQIEESYACAAYREIAGNRAAQPAFATYQGGNWGPFTLVLNFRAGMRSAQAGVQTPDAGVSIPADLSGILAEMQRKVDWCFALQFPLARAQGATATRILSRSATFGGDVPALPGVAEFAGKMSRVDPPYVLVVFGSWRIIRGYVTAVQVTHQPPYDPVTVVPYGAEVRLTVQPLMAELPTWHTIRNRTLAGTTAYSPEQLGVVVTPPTAAEQQRRADSNRRQDNAAALAARPGGRLDAEALP